MQEGKLCKKPGRSKNVSFPVFPFSPISKLRCQFVHDGKTAWNRFDKNLLCTLENLMIRGSFSEQYSRISNGYFVFMSKLFLMMAIIR